jgi:hypothetical protein
VPAIFSVVPSGKTSLFQTSSTRFCPKLTSLSYAPRILEPFGIRSFSSISGLKPSTTGRAVIA